MHRNHGVHFTQVVRAIRARFTRRRLFSWFIIAGVGLGTAGILFSQRFERGVGATLQQPSSVSADGVWQEVTANPGQRLPARARAFRMNRTALAQALGRAPFESSAPLAASQATLTLPTPDGIFARFRIEDSPAMEPGLAARFPEIQSYRGQGLDGRAMTMRCDWSPSGFHALLLTGDQAINIYPLDAANDLYASDFGGALQDQEFQCFTGEIHKIHPGESRIAGPYVAIGATLRTYRIAIAATWEYCNTFGGGTNAGTIASLNTWVNGANAVYERELAIHLNLVNNTNILFSTERGFTAGTDPFTNSNVGTMLNEVRGVLRDLAGQANYDLGHVLGQTASGASGVAFVGVVCDNTDQGGMGPLKGGGATQVSTPAGNSGALGVWVHELGHQFGANHSFNGTLNNCSQRNAGTAYESGSGETIMAYSGICGSDNISTTRDMRFHPGSYAEITSYLLGGTGGACAVTSATGNTPPTVNGGADFTIPKNTPFTLTATGGDADPSDLPNLTYAWDQIDSGGALYPQNGTSASYNDATDTALTTRPIFRPFPSTPSPSRTFPSLSYILNNANDPPDTVGGLQTAEELPRIARTLNFRVTLRDNRAGGGGVNEDSVQLTVASSGPFLVTAPNTAVSWTGGTSQNVTWSVNGTNGAPVNAANVKITLSTDGGNTFPITLLASTPNDGSQSVTAPNGILTSTARIKVEAVGNIFFDISDANFSITPGDGCPALSGLSPSIGNPGSNVVLTGINFTGVTAVKFSNNVTASFTVNSNTQLTATVPAGAVSGPITVSKTGCADLQTPPFTVCPSAPAILSVDDGSYESAFNLGSGTNYYVNRLTPASYPATLGQISIYFSSFTGITPGTSITILAGANPDGDTNIDNTMFQMVSATVGAVNQFNSFGIAPLTINSGDFVVGFAITASGTLPGLIDTTAPNMGRSYASTSPSSFSTVDSLGFPGDLPIRAQVFAGSCGGGGGCMFMLAPASQNFVAAGGNNSVTVTTGAGCNWTAMSNDGWIMITSGATGSGTGMVNYTVAANAGPARTGSMTIAGQSFTVTQDSGCAAIAVNPTTLPNGTIGVGYNQTLSATGGTGPYTFTIPTGSLPNGLTLSGAGVLSGTPTAMGTFNFTVQATAANGCTGTRAYTVQINCPTITLSPATLPNGTAGTSYNQTITASGGTAAYTFAVISGALPTGLTLSSGGALSGTPTASGAFNFTVRATDANNCTGSLGYTVQINCPTITVNPASVPNGTAGTAYNQTLSATGGTAPYSFSLSTGALPAGVTLSTAGALSGTPTVTGMFNFTAQATDNNGCVGTRAYSLQIACPTLTVNPTTLPNGTAGTAYNQTLTASGGIAPYSFSLTAGTLPAGLTLSPGGSLSGTPTVFGSFTFTVLTTDNNGCPGSRAYTLMINQPCPTITLSPATLPNGTVGSAYNQMLTASGGSGSYTFTITAGALPAGMGLSAGGNLSGTPAVGGTFNFTAQATDANNCSGTRAYTLTIDTVGLQFYPLAHPVRLLDTRAGASGCYTPNAAIAGGTSRTQPARGVCDGLTIPANAAAITGNITTVQSGGGYLTLYPSDAAQPLVANSNYGPNEILNNVFTVGLGATDGAFKIFVLSNTDIVIDVTGYYAPPGAGGLYFHPLPKPVRLLDTRAGATGCTTPNAPLPANVDTTQQARGVCDGVMIPDTALAIVGNATTVNPQGPGFPYLTLFPADAARPLVASSNYLPGQIMNAPFTVGLSSAGQFKIYPTTQTELVVDVLGYYSAEASDTNGAGLLFYALPHPVRLLDTRAGTTGCYTPNAPLPAGSTRTQPARGLCDGVTVAANALGIIGNATVVLPQSGGYLTFWPSDAAQPLVAISNFTAGQVFNRHFTVGLGAGDGAFKIFTSATTELVIDVSGFFAP